MGFKITKLIWGDKLWDLFDDPEDFLDDIDEYVNLDNDISEEWEEDYIFI